MVQRIKLLITMDNSFFATFSILITNRMIGHAYAIDKNDNMVIFLFVLQQDQNILLIYLPSYCINSICYSKWLSTCFVKY
jgi:hypothetical protein